MKELLPEIERWRKQGDRVAVATVVASRRSAPRPIGSKLVVSERGEVAGSVSGGCVESDVCEAAQEVLRTRRPRLLSYGIEDETAFSVGLPCGGEIDVFVEELERIVDEGERAVLFTVIDGEPLGAKLLVWADGKTEGDGPPDLAEDVDELLVRGRGRLLEQEGRRVFAEVFAPPPRLLVFGAVDTAEALCAAAKQLGWTTIVADARSRFATPERLPSADEIIVDWPAEALAQVQPDAATAVIVLTHDEKFDLPALQGALGTEAFYVGALGSRRAQEQRRERLLEAGVAEEDLHRIAGPCGLDIGAETPPETALSILAETVAARVGRAGGRLKESRGSIHVVRSEVRLQA